MAYQATGAEVSRLSLSGWGFLFTSWRLGCVNACSSFNVRGFRCLWCPCFFPPCVSEFLWKLLFKWSLCLADFSVVIHCDYAGALLRWWWGAGEQRHSIILWLNLRPFSAWILVVFVFQGTGVHGLHPSEVFISCFPLNLCEIGRLELVPAV